MSEYHLINFKSSEIRKWLQNPWAREERVSTRHYESLVLRVEWNKPCNTNLLSNLETFHPIDSFLGNNWTIKPQDVSCVYTPNTKAVGDEGNPIHPDIIRFFSQFSCQNSPFRDIIYLVYAIYLHIFSGRTILLTFSHTIHKQCFVPRMCHSGICTNFLKMAILGNIFRDVFQNGKIAVIYSSGRSLRSIDRRSTISVKFAADCADQGCRHCFFLANR